MKEYFMLFKDTQKKGVPVYFDAELHEKFNPKNPMPGMDYPWAMPLHKKVEYPESLWLITKDKSLLFDYYPEFSGHVISREFKKMLDDFRIDGYIEVSLKTVSKKNEKVTSKEYSLITFYKDYDYVDYEKSVYTKKNKFSKGEGWMVGTDVKKYNTLCLKEGITRDLFAIKDQTFYENLFCSEKFAAEAIKRKMYGINFIPVEKAATFYNKFYGF